jgi:ribulose kinase
LGKADAWPAGTEGLLFLPYLAGERTPVADPDAHGAFVGLGLRHDRGALTRAVLEGVAFGLRDSLDLVVGLGGKPALGRVSGGGARSTLWLQIIASALELPLQRLSVDEGAAFGAAILGGTAAGLWGDVHQAVAATVKAGETIDPVPEWMEVYREQRERYRALYPALRARTPTRQRGPRACRASPETRPGRALSRDPCRARTIAISLHATSFAATLPPPTYQPSRRSSVSGERGTQLRSAPIAWGEAPQVAA